METAVGINSLSMKISMPKSAPKAPLSLGAFTPQPLEGMNDAVSPANPKAKLSFATTMPFVAPTQNMPTLEDSRSVGHKIMPETLFEKPKPSVASVESTVTQPVKTTEQALAMHPKDKPVIQNEGNAKADQEISREESLSVERKEKEKLEEVKKELKEQASEKSEVQKQPEKSNNEDKEKKKRVIDTKALAIRTGFMLGKLFTFLLFNSSSDLKVSGKNFDLPLTPPEGEPGIEDEALKLNRANSWRNIVESLQSMENVNMVTFLMTGLSLVLTSIPLKIGKDTEAGKVKSFKKISGVLTKTFLPRLSLRSR